MAEEIGEFLNSADQIIDGGACTVGVESTIIDCTGEAPRILRPGAITLEMIEASTGINGKKDINTSQRSNQKSATEFRVSGSLENHYAPAAKVILDVQPVSGQGFIAIAKIETPAGVIRLAAPKSDSEFAQVLYAALRRADSDGLKEVVVHQPTGVGIAIAIRDRLKRAATGR